MTHVVLVSSNESGYFWQCSCGDRSTEFMDSRWDAQDAASAHEYDVKQGRHRVPTSRPTMRSLVKLYRQKAQQETYTPKEREQWTALADEIESQIDLSPQQSVIDGQISLFD